MGVFDVSTHEILVDDFIRRVLLRVMNAGDYAEILRQPGKITDRGHVELDHVWLLRKPNGTERVLHIEVQSTNDRNMPRRMARYYGALRAQYEKQTIEQVVLYIGSKKMTMKNTLAEGLFVFSYKLIDIRDLDSSMFLKPGHPTLALLGSLAKPKAGQTTEGPSRTGDT